MPANAQAFASSANRASVQGRGRSPPRLTPAGSAVCPGSPQKRTVVNPARPAALDSAGEEELPDAGPCGSASRTGSRESFWMSVGSTLVLPSAEELARAAPKTPSHRKTPAGSQAHSCHDSSEEEQDVAYYSEPEREVRRAEPDMEIPRADTLCDVTALVHTARNSPPPSPLRRGRALAGADRRQEAEPSSPSTASQSPRPKLRAASEPMLVDVPLPGCQAQARTTEACTAASAATAAAKSTAAAVSACMPRESKADAEHVGDFSFMAWVADEVRSRPDEAQLLRVPESHLLQVAMVPQQLERLLILGFFLCLDILLHELSFTPLQAAWASLRLLVGARRWGCQEVSSPSRQRRKLAAGKDSSGGSMLTITEQGDFLRLSLLILNVACTLLVFDMSWVYHYIRGESFLKLYVIFNMLEMFERWCRSVGVDMFDLLMTSARNSFSSLVKRYAFTLAYCFVHSAMHLIRVILLNVAINTSSSAVFLIIVTNNFGEIKSTVFKRYDEKSLFPIITSDIVERFYLLLDIVFVLARMSISTYRVYSAFDVTFWFFLLVALELCTDWIKFCLIMKFSELPVKKTFEVYKEVLLADILLCRFIRLGNEGSQDTLAKGSGSSGSSADAATAGANKETSSGREKSPSVAKERPFATLASSPAVPFRGIHSFSHSLQRRLGFSGVPMTTILVVHLVMLARSPCVLAVRKPGATVSVFIAAFFLLCLLAKILLGIVLVGYAANRRSRIPRGLELLSFLERFAKIKSL